MPTTATNLCQAKVSYKKVQGILELNNTHLQWTQNGQNVPSIRVPHRQAACRFLRYYHYKTSSLKYCTIALFCSKEGSPQVKLRLGLVGDDSGHTFMFISPQPTASTEREAFKRELTSIISNNRNGMQLDRTETKSVHTPLEGQSQRLRASTSRATSVSSNERASSSTPSRAIDDFRIRKKVLMKTPELATLHRELVLTGQITETEFWEGREVFLSTVESFDWKQNFA